VDRPEVVDRDDLGWVGASHTDDAGARYDAVDDIGKLLHAGDCRSSTLGGPEVGDDIGVALVDSDDTVALYAQHGHSSCADPACSAAYDVCFHASLILISPARVAT